MLHSQSHRRELFSVWDVAADDFVCVLRSGAAHYSITNTS